VYRLGQTKDVFIKRMLMRDSVEANMHKLNEHRSEYEIHSNSKQARERMRTQELRVWLIIYVRVC
jgi:SNF2 family DNA or RNA helicase